MAQWMAHLIAYWRWRRELRAANRDVTQAWMRMVTEQAARERRTAGQSQGFPLDLMREWNRLAGVAQMIHESRPQISRSRIRDT